MKQRFNVKMQDPTNANKQHICPVDAIDFEAAIVEANMLFGGDNVLGVELKQSLAKFWREYEGEGNHILLVDGVQVASVQATEYQKRGEPKEFGWEVYNYDSDFQAMLKPVESKRFNDVEEAKQAVEELFRNWVKGVYNQLVSA